MGRSWPWLLVLATLILVAPGGCGFITFARVSVNDHITPAAVTFIIPGQTTFHEIVSRLGVPDEIMESESGAVASYHFRDAKYSRINFGWPLRFWSPVQPDFIFSATGLGTDVFQVTLNRQWVAENHAFSKHATATRYTLWPF